MGVEFEAIPSNFEENLDESRDPKVVAIELALGKAKDVAKDHPDAYVIGSDTIVTVDNRQMEKPIDLEDARSLLLALSGRESSVVTSIAIVNISKGIELTNTDTTRVFFKSDNDEVAALRQTYLDSEDWVDKAGGYGIQSGAAPLIDKIEGEYTTVVGLPSHLLTEMLEKIGIQASPVIEEAPVLQVMKD